MDWNHQLVVCPCWVIWREVSVINKIWCLVSRWDQLGLGSQRANQLALNNWKVNLPAKAKRFGFGWKLEDQSFPWMCFFISDLFGGFDPHRIHHHYFFASIWGEYVWCTFSKHLKTLESQKSKFPVLGWRTLTDAMFVFREWLNMFFLVILESLKILYPQIPKMLVASGKQNEQTMQVWLGMFIGKRHVYIYMNQWEYNTQFEVCSFKECHATS